MVNKHTNHNTTEGEHASVMYETSIADQIALINNKSLVITLPLTGWADIANSLGELGNTCRWPIRFQGWHIRAISVRPLGHDPDIP